MVFAQLLTGGVGGGSGLAQGVRGMQASLISRRLRLMCAASTTDDNSSDTTGTMCCDAGVSPTQMEIGGGEGHLNILPKLLGSAVGNAAVVIAAFVARATVSTAMRRFMGRAHVLGDRRMVVLRRNCVATLSSLMRATIDTLFMRPIGPIAALWGAYVMLVSPSVGASLGIVFLPETLAGLRVAGVLILCLWAVPWAVCIVVLCWRHRDRPFPFRSRKLTELGTSSHTCASIWRRIVEPSEELDAPSGARHDARQLLIGYAPVFESFVARRFWYFNVEMALSFATGLVSGAAYRDSVLNPCAEWEQWCFVSLSVLEMILTVVMMPYSAWLDTLSVLAISGLSTLSLLAPLVSDAGDPVSSAATVASAVLQGMLLILSLGLRLTSGTSWRSVRGITANRVKAANFWSVGRRPAVANTVKWRKPTTFKSLPQLLATPTSNDALRQLIEVICS